MKKIRTTALTIGDQWLEGKTFFFSRSGYEALRRDLEKESDRGLILIVTAVMDSILGKYLTKQCVKGNAETKRRLFDPGGPFHGLSPKIEWLYCSGVLSKPIRDDLHLLRAVRNRCAHSLTSFQMDGAIENAFLKKMSAYSFIKTLEESILDRENKHGTHIVETAPRLKFMVIASLLFVTIDAILLRAGRLPRARKEEEGKERA